GRSLLTVRSPQPTPQKRSRLWALGCDAIVVMGGQPLKHLEQSLRVGLVRGPDGLRTKDAINGYWVAEEHQRLLQQTVRRRRSHVDGHVEDLCGHGFIIKAPISVLRVEVAVVDGDGVLPG